MKLSFLKLFKGLERIKDLEDPGTIRRTMEEEISRAGLNSDDAEWMSLLDQAYTEAYAQWFSSLGKEKVRDMAQNSERYIVADQRKVGNVMERQVLSAFNIIGSAIHKAMQITECAYKLVTQKSGNESQNVEYRWDSRTNPTHNREKERMVEYKKGDH